MRAFFAHSLNNYGTKAEKEIMFKATALFKSVENPSDERHQKQFKSRGAGYFSTEVIPNTEAVVFLAMPNGTIAHEVGRMIDYFVRNELPVIEAVPVYGGKFGYTFRYINSPLVDRYLTPKQTQKYIKNVLKYRP